MRVHVNKDLSIEVSNYQSDNPINLVKEMVKELPWSLVKSEFKVEPFSCTFNISPYQHLSYYLTEWDLDDIKDGYLITFKII